jgi:hypothetical protein
LQSLEAKELLERANADLEARFNQLVSRPDSQIEPEDVLLGAVALERDAEACRAEALSLELKYLCQLFTDTVENLVSSRAKRVIHVRRDAAGQIQRLIEL